jgi:hypothetical protein
LGAALAFVVYYYVIEWTSATAIPVLRKMQQRVTPAKFEQLEAWEDKI